MKRKNLEETWKHLEKNGWKLPRDKKGLPFVPPQMPSTGDYAPLGLSFFREFYEDDNLSGLTLPRTFFARSEIVNVNFANTDLSESRMCWNDFIGCDFTGAQLHKCDLRATTFINCNFQGTDFQGADFRRSYFEDCDFTDAKFAKAISYKGDKSVGIGQFLSKAQIKDITWKATEGEFPEGG